MAKNLKTMWNYEYNSQTKYSHGQKKRPFLTLVKKCFYQIILKCPYEGVSFVFCWQIYKYTNNIWQVYDNPILHNTVKRNIQ